MIHTKTLAVCLLAFISTSSCAPPQPPPGDASDFPINAVTLPEGWKAEGCYSDNARYRQLSDFAHKDAKRMTREACISWCDKRQYMYSGVEDGDVCYCGVELQPLSKELKESECDEDCAGKESEKCGGKLAFELFSNENYIVHENPGPDGAWSKGCYLEQQGKHRVLEYAAAVEGGPENMTIANCVWSCRQEGYLYAGVQHSDKCYCGDTIDGEAVGNATGATGCSWRCSGNVSEWCGGRKSTNVYKLPWDQEYFY